MRRKPEGVSTPKRALISCLLVASAALLPGCGRKDSSTTTPQTPRGTLIALIGDAPLCDLLTFRPAVNKLTVTTAEGRDEGVLFSTPSFAPSIKVNVADLRDSATYLYVANVAEGTYSTITVGLSNAQLVLYDPSQSPPIDSRVANLLQSEPKATIVPPLTIKKGEVSVLRLDLDLMQSVVVDAATGQVTGDVNPTFRAAALSSSDNQPFIRLDNVRGFVQRVDTTAINPEFAGDIQVQLLEGAPLGSSTGAPAILVNLTACTETQTECSQILGPPALNQLETGSYVEVDGLIDIKGNFVADIVDVQHHEVVEENRLAFIGTVLAVTRDGSGNLTQFDFYVHEQQPSAGFTLPTDSVVVVNVSSSTLYRFSSPPSNFANLSFGPEGILPGVGLVVHGVFTVPPRPPAPAQPPPATVAAEKIYVKLQTHQGQFSSLVQAGSDDRTGAFYLTPCENLLLGAQAPRVMVITNNGTQFINVGGLSQLAPQPALVVRGLPFFQPQATTVNGVAVPAGTLVILARQVHQLT